MKRIILKDIKKMEQKERIELLAKNGWRVKGLTAEGFVIFALADGKTLIYYHGQYLTKKEYDKSIKRRHLPDYGLMKIPDAYFLRLARREIGELKSYVQELEDKIKTLQEQQLSNEMLRGVNRKYKQEIKRLSTELSELKERLMLSRMFCKKLIDMSQYNAIYHYEVKDFYNNQFVRCKVRCLVIGETVKSYRIRLLEPCRNRMALEEMWVGKRAIFRSRFNNENGVCDIYELNPADVSCRACLQKCYRRWEMEAKYKKK